ncbi:MAG: tetratricopeptide repeat protein, partial [Kiloniellales bacterium]|nr:tetratricopeptide repeat protein [Kiloniellales bacterium]
MRKRLLLGTAIVLLPLIAGGCSEYEGLPVPGVAEEEVKALRGTAHDMGVFHFSVGNYGLAVQHFQAATSREPRSIEAWNGLAASYDKISRFDLAERYYRRALSLDPQSAQTLNNMGYSYWLQGRYDLAIAFLRDADRLDGGNRVIEANRKIARDAYQAAQLTPRAETREVDEESDALLSAVPSEHGARLERVASGVQKLVTKPSKREDDFGISDAALTSGLRVTASENGPMALPRPLSENSYVEQALAVPLQNVEFGGELADLQSSASDGAPTIRQGEDTILGRPGHHGAPLVLTAGMMVAPDPGLTGPAKSAERRYQAHETFGDYLEAGIAENGPMELTSEVAFAQVPGAPPAYKVPVLDQAAPRILVANAAGRDGMAERLGRFLKLKGLPASRLANADDFGREMTMIIYYPGWQV